MKDLDFDELDRAVNTLMGTVSKTDTPGADPSIKTVSITPTLSPESTSPTASAVPTEPAPNPVAASSTPPAPTPSLAAKRGGRFMDVVHSSSDMKKDKPTMPVSRQGTTIEPTKPVAPEMPKPVSTPVEPVSEVAPAPTPVQTPEETGNSSHSDWPDPLEMTGFNKAEEEKPEPETTPEPTPLLEESSETPVATPASEDLQPLSSPFLADAKVEKRPLGGALLTEAEEAPEPDHTPVVPNADDGTVNDPKDQLPPIMEETKKELPPEYQGDLVAIESGSVEPSVAAEAPEEKKPEVPKEEKKEDTHPAALLEAKTEDDHAYAGPTSIAQQYKEEPNSGDQHNGAIYDTEAYHKPLAHPAKKKSGWMVVIWILVILVVGAGAGAALYFLGIF